MKEIKHKRLHTKSGSTCTKCPEIGKSIKDRSGGQQLGEGAGGAFLGMKFLMGVMKMFWELDGVNGCTSLYKLNTTTSYILKIISF